MSADVQLYDLIITERELDWAAQDFESLPDGAITSFSWSAQSGNQFLSFALIQEQGDLGGSFGVEDFEIYPDGFMDKIDQSVSSGTVTLNIGYIYPPPAPA